MENVHDVSGHGQSKGTPSKGVALGGDPQLVASPLIALFRPSEKNLPKQNSTRTICYPPQKSKTLTQQKCGRS